MIRISIEKSIYADVVNDMVAGNTPWTPPKGVFYLLSGGVVPFTPQPAILRIETDRIGEVLNIDVNQTGEFGSGVDIRQKQVYHTVVATSSITKCNIQLSRGTNFITVYSSNSDVDTAYLIINATTIAAFFESFARVLYSVSTRIIDDQKSIINSRVSTRLVEPFIYFQELLPDISSLRTLAIRMLTKGLIHSVGTELGVAELAKALSLVTPIYKDMDKDSFEVFPSLDPWTKSASQFGGRELHVWVPNTGMSNWVAFLRYISNQSDLYQIINVNEMEVSFKYQGLFQKHLFDFDSSPNYLTSQASSSCFTSIYLDALIQSVLTINMCAAAYTFDLYITENSMIGDGRKHFDSGVPFDSNVPFDLDPIDPYSDGWVGLSLTGRFEQDYPIRHTLDTFVVPSTTYTGDICSYQNGWYTQIVETENYELEIPSNIQISGYMQTAWLFVLESPNGTRWDIRVHADSQTLIAKSIPNTSLSLFNYELTKPDTSAVSFFITDEGLLQTTTTIDANALATDTLYISADDGSVWWVTVGDDNIIKTTKIYLD